MAESRNKRVLIVDNDQEEARTLGVMLRRAGHSSSTTWSGLEALELLKSGEYDILLVSSYLPDLYVGDFFERLSHLPVQPCSIVMQEGRTPAVTLLEVKSRIGQETRQEQ
jgi:CheY-like chemotaxis protein